jgi:ElaB/YqjD/DUF883 family membrane-anchored ribosome-binding protein
MSDSDDTETIQATLDAAQDDLQKNVAELKHLIEDKLETPKHVLEVAEKPVAFVRDHGVLIGVGVVFALGLLVGRMIEQR